MFSQFGELEDAVVTTDRVSGKSKGYGFVTFRYAASASSAVAEPEKQLDVRNTFVVRLCPPVERELLLMNGMTKARDCILDGECSPNFIPVPDVGSFHHQSAHATLVWPQKKPVCQQNGAAC